LLGENADSGYARRVVTHQSKYPVEHGSPAGETKHRPAWYHGQTFKDDTVNDGCILSIVHDIGDDESVDRSHGREEADARCRESGPELAKP
jgi:hypothetical protein